jgi:hypothetical protein
VTKATKTTTDQMTESKVARFVEARSEKDMFELRHLLQGSKRSGSEQTFPHPCKLQRQAGSDVSSSPTISDLPASKHDKLPRHPQAGTTILIQYNHASLLFSYFPNRWSAASSAFLNAGSFLGLKMTW